MTNRDPDVAARTAVPLVLLTGFVAPYRVALYERLASWAPGMQVWVSTTTESDREWEPSSDHAFTVRRVRGFSMPRSRIGRTGQDLHVPVGAFFDLVRTKPGVVVSGEFGFRTLSACAYRVVRRSSRLVVWATLSERTERERSKGRNRLRRLILTRADAVVVNGPSGARYIRSLNPEIELHVVHQATPAPAAQPRPRPQLAEGASLKLLFVGQLIERKGLMSTIPELSAWTRQTGRRISLTVVGGGPQREALEELARDAGQEVDFLGSLPYDEVLNAYADADALFFPSLEDEWGLVVNEALQAGRPVIGGLHAQAVQCLVHDGVSGVVFDPLEPSSLAAALDRLDALLAGDPEALVMHCLKSVSVASIDLMAAGVLSAAGLAAREGQAVTPPEVDPVIDR